MLLVNDIAECMTDLQNIFHSWDDFSDARKIALLDLRFNLGAGGFRSFKRMIAAIKARNWVLAAAEALDSRWAVQVQLSRVRTIEGQLVEG
jgi:lysozyme